VIPNSRQCVKSDWHGSPGWCCCQEHFLGRTVGCPPLLDPTLQRPQLSVAELTWLRLVKVLKQCRGLQARFDLAPLLKFFPHLGERIEPRLRLIGVIQSGPLEEDEWIIAPDVIS